MLSKNESYGGTLENCEMGNRLKKTGKISCQPEEHYLKINICEVFVNVSNYHPSLDSLIIIMKRMCILETPISFVFLSCSLTQVEKFNDCV